MSATPLFAARRTEAEAPPARPMPAAPHTPEETGLPPSLLWDLVLKVMLEHGLGHLQALSSHLGLSAALLDVLLGRLRREQLVEVRRRGQLDGDVLYDLTGAGRSRAAEALARNRYTGPAPVTLADYRERVRLQSVGTLRVTRARLQAALADVVLREELRDALGPAMNSGRAMLLYGPPGAGKSYLGGLLARLLHGRIAVPHAIEVAGEIVRVHDPLIHRPAAPAAGTAAATLDNRDRSDGRWVECERPFVMTGGELTLEMLDLVHDPRAGYYQAPPHFKANNGLFLVDDLGRQLVTPRQLLNRWIVPMETRQDFLMLRSGSKFAIPFDTLLLFSTNLVPAEVADEAFLRRLGHKIHVGGLPAAHYRRLVRAACEERDVACDEAAVEWLLERRHAAEGRPLLACYPRDLVAQVADHAAYHDCPAALTPTSIDRAWRTYFALGAERA